MPTNEYLPVATAGGANVDSQANFAGSGYQTDGFTVGIAQPYQANKIWRQASMVAAALTGFIVNQLGISIADDGNLANLITNLTNAIKSASSPVLIPVAFSATPVFPATGANLLTFEITLTGNVTSSTLTGATDGQIINFIIHQDGTGGHTFAWPASVPGAIIGAAAGNTSVQAFIVDGAGNLHTYTPLTTDS